MLILLAGINEAALRNLRSCVEKCYPGSEIVCFTCTDTAMNYAKTSGRAIDICFTSVKLQSGTGIELFRKLRNHDRMVRGVLIADSDAYALTAWQALFNDYLIEPLDAQKVRHTVESCEPFATSSPVREYAYGT